MAQLAAGLGAAHALGILHRDLKPDNVLLVNGRPVATDFGLARLDGGERERLTRTGEILGTPSYMAPEQAEGDPRLIDARADVYGLGAVLYAALTGRPPFSGASLLATLRKVLEERPPSPRDLGLDVPQPIAAVCLRCLEKDPGNRYSSALALAAELEDLLVAPEQEPPRPRSGKVLLGLGAAALLAGTAGLSYVLGRSGSDQPASPEPSAAAGSSLPSAAPPTSTPVESPGLSSSGDVWEELRAATAAGQLERAQRSLDEHAAESGRAAWALASGYLCVVRSEHERPVYWRERAKSELRRALTLDAQLDERARASALLALLDDPDALKRVGGLDGNASEAPDPLTLAAQIRDRRRQLSTERTQAQARATQERDVGKFCKAGEAQAEGLTRLAAQIEALSPPRDSVELEAQRASVSLELYLAPLNGAFGFGALRIDSPRELDRLTRVELGSLEDFERALAHARAAQRLAPERALGWLTEAAIYKLVYEEALRGTQLQIEVSRRLFLTPRERVYTEALARLQGLKLFTNSYRAFEAALRRAPDNGRAYLDRSYLQLIAAEGIDARLEGALSDSERAVELEPEDAHFVRTREIVRREVSRVRGR